MSYRISIYIVIFLLLLFYSGVGSATTKFYAIVIGNNAAPPGSALSKLRYADDDAIRFYRFFKHMSDEVFLLTIPDGRTQRRYPSIAKNAVVPNRTNLDKYVQALSRKIAIDKSHGIDSILYFVFSGHGAYSESGIPYLSLLDAGLTRDKLFDAVDKISADFTHLFIDACYADGIVGIRGMFDTEVDTRHVKLTIDTQKSVLDSKSRETSLPGLGVVMASSEFQKTHEWSQIESGIFTHEVLSGLFGPADINLDGKIEYSELVAFVSAANRDVIDERGKIKVIAKPPDRNHSIPLVDIGKIKQGVYLVGNPSSLGHFFIELENGERYLDANLTNLESVHIILPSSKIAYLLSGKREAKLQTGPGRILDIANLSFGAKRYIQKGSIEASFRKGLFNMEYSLAYYKGFIDSTLFSSVRFNVPKMEIANNVVPLSDKNYTFMKSLSITSYSLVGVSAVAAIVSGVFALRAKHDFDNTSVEATSLDANKDFKKYTAIFWPTVALVPVAVLTGWLLMPKKRKYKENKSKVFSVYSDFSSVFTMEF